MVLRVGSNPWRCQWLEKAPGRKRNVDRAGGALGFGVKRLEWEFHKKSKPVNQEYWLELNRTLVLGI